MTGPITYEMLSAAVASLVVVGGAWFFIERRIREVEKEAWIQIKANQADISVLRETMLSKYVSTDALIRLEERIVGELREIRRLWENLLNDRHGQ
jgi:hypothetical protein